MSLKKVLQNLYKQTCCLLLGVHGLRDLLAPPGNLNYAEWECGPKVRASGISRAFFLIGHSSGVF